MMIGFGFWMLGRVAVKDFPRRLELLLWTLAFCICCYGWTLTYFPSARVDHTTGVILPLDLDPHVAFGTIDQISSSKAMMNFSVMLMTLLMTVHFSRQQNTRVMIAVMVTVSGLIAALVGLWFQTPEDLLAIWRVAHVPSSVFGLFWYHGNAAAFLNLTWPAGVWLLVVLVQSGRHGPKKQVALALLMASVLVQIIAVFVNVSKMGHIALTMEGILLATGLLYRGSLGFRLLNGGTIARGAIALLFALTLLGVSAWFTGAGNGWSRWRIFSTRGFDDPARRHAAEMALQIGSDAGLTGTGPGTFEWISAHYSTLDPILSPGRWRYAHNDYAQFYAEWGLIGCALTAALLLLPVAYVVREVMSVLIGNRKKRMSPQRSSGLLCFPIAVASVLIHALIDFPLQIMATQIQFAVVSGLAFGMSIPTAYPSMKKGGTQRARSEPSTFSNAHPLPLKLY